MPRDLFRFTDPNAASPQRRWTLVLSLIAHGALLLALVVLSVTSALDGAQVVRRLDGYFVASPPPEPPPVPPAPAPAKPDVASTTPALSPSVAPSMSPSNVTPEIDSRPVPAGLGFQPASGSGIPGGIGATATLPSAPPPPAVMEIPRVGGLIRPPARLVYVPPSYPPLALSARVEGEVVLEAVIDETGAVRTPKVIKSILMLDRAAIEAVTKWRYTPTRLNGVAVPVIMMITVRFALR
jgi:periplasmic protein TonB